MQRPINPILLVNLRLARRGDNEEGVRSWEGATMMKHAERGELDVIPPLGSVSITLDVSPLEIELALATAAFPCVEP